MQQRNKESFFFSILTALAAGLTISLVFICVIRYGKSIFSKIDKIQTNTASVNNVKDYSQNEEDEDQTFISKFSRAYIYSKEYEGEVIERAQDSLPKEYRQGNITAKAFGVIYLERDITLIEKDSGTHFPIASITKLVTAVIAKKLIDEHKIIEITDKILAPSGSSAHLRLGERFSYDELLYPLLMVSSNDSAEALAQSYGRKEFIKAMNDWASDIGAYQTYFKDPSGLSPENVSTVHDLVIIVKWILEHDPDIFDTTIVKSKNIRLHTWVNPTHFLNLTSYAGGKNGYLPEAGRTSVSLWRLGNSKRLYLSIILGSTNRDADTLKVLDLSLK